MWTFAKVVRRASSFIAFVSDALVDEALHALDELGGGESASRFDGATQPAIDDAAHTFEHAPQYAFRQCFLAPFLFYLLRLELAGRVF